jgi:hypothetical protein
MTSLAWPVCDLILSVDTPACRALVAKPGAQAVAREADRIDIGCGDALLQNERYGLT